MARKPRKLGFFSAKMSNINTFYFDKAKYRAGDVFGNEIFAAIDYKNNNFEIIEITKMDDNILVLRQQVTSVARDLLSRKHNVNFAKKFQ